MYTRKIFGYGIAVAIALAFTALSLTGCPDGNNLIRANLTGSVSFDNNAPKVGDIITATYSPGNGSGVQTWQWFRADGTDDLIPGAAVSAYTVTAADAGKKIKVQLSFADQNGSVSATTTNAVAAASSSDLQLSGTISISPGTGVTINTELTAIYSGNETVSYQWKKDGGNVGTNSNKYTPTTAGSYTVMASATGYQSKTSAAVTVTASNGPIGHTHDWNDWVTTTPATCTTDGMKTRTCKLDATHTETDKIDALGHDWGEWTVIKAATATEGGVDTRTCKHDTTHKETRNTSATGEPGHEHDWGNWTRTTAATCTNPGVEIRTCKLDATHTETQPIEAIGHDWDEWTQIKAPTCTEAGEKTRTCKHDGTEKETETVSALGHDSGAWHTTLDPNCTVTGTKELRCTIDNAVLGTDTIAIDPDAHDWEDDWTETKAATEHEDGEAERVCKHNEEHKQTRPIAKLDHIFDWGEWEVTKAATCTEEGEETRHCKNDSKYYETQPIEINPDAHNYEWGQTTAPTCTTAGIDTGTCTHDNAHTTTRTGAAALEHDSGAWHITLAATCTVAGTRELRCTRDGAVLGTDTIPIDPTAHNYGNWTQTKAPTTTVDGEETRTCTLDPTHKETHILYATGTVGLSFTLIYNNPAYTVNKGSINSGTVYIPAYWRPNADSEYLPVTYIIGTSFNNTSIAAVTFLENSRLESIGYQAFYGCTDLTSITLPASLTAIGYDAFYSCSNLTSVIFAEGSQLQSIGTGAFSGCRSLTNITIPASVTSIGGQAFSGCSSLTAITVDTDNPNYSTQDGIVYNKEKTTIIAVPTGISGAVTLPTSVTSIGGSAFQYCTSLTSITIPEGVTSIGGSAFHSWTSSQTIYIHDFANQVAADAAWGSGWRNYCNAVIVYGHDWSEWNEVTAPTCTTTGVRTRVCAICGETETIMPPALGHDYNWTQTQAPTVTEDGAETGVCKHDSSHTQTRTVYATGTMGLAFEAIGYPATAYRVRKGSVSSGVVYIPSYHLDNATNEYLPITEIGNASETWEGAFINTGITAVHIPASVTSIGVRAFEMCRNLTAITVDGNNPNYTSEGGILYNKAKTELLAYPSASGTVTIPAGVTSIGENAFAQCSLASITLPVGVTSIGNSAFSGCDNLASITLPAGVTSIGNEAFFRCESLTSITLPAGVTSIGNGAFWSCWSLSSITLPESVTSIGDSAFYDTGLTSISIPAGVTSIGDQAFYYWRSVQTIYIEGYASESAADTAWGVRWRYLCNATREYLQNDGTWKDQNGNVTTGPGE